MMQNRRAEPARRRRPRSRLLVRLYGIGIATMLAIGVTIVAAHLFFYFPPLRWVVRMSAALVDRAAAPLEHGALGPYLEKVRRECDVSMSVYDPRGALLASNVAPPLPAPTRAEIAAASSSAISRPRGFIVVAPIHRGDALLGFGVAQPPRDSPPLSSLGMDLAIVVVLIGLAALLVSRILGRPLNQIARAARVFGHGDLSVRTGMDRDDEIGDVARAFDEMSERIGRLLDAERELLASVSHELRTPLARIRVAIDLAAEGDAETARGSLIDVSEDLTELEELITSIFSAARLEMARQGRDPQLVPLHRVHLDLVTLIEKAVGRLRGMFPDRAFMLEVAPTVAGGVVHADPVLIRRAVENVLENAHKYSSPTTPVATVLSRRGDTFYIEISDRGFGIAPSDLPRVFSPFFRADRSRTRATGGVGLGLMLAKRVVEAHGGTIDLTSQLDVGTIVTFHLPLAAAPI
jgi:signal transduction histidine kinase